MDVQKCHEYAQNVQKIDTPKSRRYNDTCLGKGELLFSGFSEPNTKILCEVNSQCSFWMYKDYEQA